MQSGWRLYAVMIGLAALTGTVVALALSGGPRLPSESPRRASPTATASATASPTRSPSTQASPSPAASPSTSPSTSPSAAPTDPLQRVRPLVFAWRPSDTTTIVEQRTENGSRIIAVPLDEAAATPLLDLPAGTEWHIRRDGSAIALTVDLGSVSAPRLRIAALNLQTGAVGWITPNEPTLSQRTPVWSNDGTVVYYSKTSIGEEADLGIFRIRADGSNLTQLRGPSNDGAIRLRGLTPDGLGLVLSRTVVSGVVDVLDLNTRAIRGFVNPPYDRIGSRPSGEATSWRPQRPRALVSFGGPAGGPRVYVWDDQAPPASPAPLLPNETYGADWDPTGARIVVARSVPNGPVELVTVDANGQNLTPLPGTDAARSPYWLRAGIVYLYGTRLATEVRLVQPSGALAPKTLFSGTEIVRLLYVTP